MLGLFLPSIFRAFPDEGCFRASEVLAIPLSSETKANTMERGLLKTIGDCQVDPVFAFLSFAWEDKIYEKDSETLNWNLCDLFAAKIVAVLDWKADKS